MIGGAAFFTAARVEEGGVSGASSCPDICQAPVPGGACSLTATASPQVDSAIDHISSRDLQSAQQLF